MAVGIKKHSVLSALCVLLFAQGFLFAGNSLVLQTPPLAALPDSIPAGGDKDTSSAISRGAMSPADTSALADSLSFIADSALQSGDSVKVPADSLPRRDSLKHKGSFLDEVLSGESTDSLVYFVRSKKVYSYMGGDIKYTDVNLKADYIVMDMETKLIHAKGLPKDSTGRLSRPSFFEKETEYGMDSVVYNVDSKMAKTYGILTQEGEGILRGGEAKKMPDNTINIAHGKFSVCDHEHPHFYIDMTKAKVMPGKKVVMGPSYLNIEDVPIYFLGVPFGFFPLSNNRASGFIMPTFGEQAMKGFFLKDGGYYYAPNDYIDFTILGGIYTLGSWETRLASRYVKRYKYQGNLNLDYSQEVFGDKGSADFENMTNFRAMWTHNQDPKFRPNSTFAASVNFSTSGYNKYSSNNLNDYVSSQTNSSISYSKNWVGKPFSFSTNMSHSQNNRDTTISLTFPNMSFSMSRINPFQRKEAVGKQRWYEKIAMTYSGTLSNSVTAKEYDLFTEQTLKNMRNGINHTIPVSTSLNLFNYINIEPRVNYQERWYFSKVDKEWNPEKKMVQTVDTTYGFYRLYNYSYAVSASTRLYGMYQFKPGSSVQAIRHTMTPTVSFSYAPSFADSKYGYYKSIQTDSTGRIGYYSPYETGMYGVPSRSKSGSLSFSLANTLEMKVRAKNDSVGVRKIKLIDNLSMSGSYNFLADSLRFSNIPVSFRSTIVPELPINLNMVFDLYQVDKKSGRRIDKFLVEEGKLARLVSVGTNVSYSFSGGGAKNNSAALNAGNNAFTGGMNGMPVSPEEAEIEPAARRLVMSGMYYDFAIPYNFNLNYGINYNNNGIKKTVTQTLGFSSSVTVTPKWGATFSGGYDFEAKKLTPGQFVLTRDLHCWQMNFSWIPIGFMQSWSFNISVKSGMLKDLKYDKSSSFYDNYYDK